MKNIFSILILTFLISLVSCWNDNSSFKEDKHENAYKISDNYAGSVSSDMVKANNNFAGRIFEKISNVSSGKNIMISPLSISIALSMILNGASGDNLTEMKDVLGFGSMDNSAINQQFYNLISSLESVDQDLILSIANSEWTSDLYEQYVYESFITALKDYYSAEVNTLDFSDSKSADTINSWVSENTMGKIQKVINQDDLQYMIMVLINAVYFKGTWRTTFDSDATYTGSFTLSDGSTKQVELMTYKDTQQFRSFKSEAGSENGYCAVRLPYGRDKVAFYGFIPASGTLDDFISAMSEKGFNTLFSNLTDNTIPVIMPEFKFGYERSIKDILQSLGMSKAFNSGGFLNLAQDTGFCISDVFHKTFIEVNEQGTEAAAVTAVIGATCVRDSVEFIATKPFLFVIRDDRSGTILFIGKVEDPSLLE